MFICLFVCLFVCRFELMQSLVVVFYYVSIITHYFYYAVPSRGAKGLSAVCDCGIS